MRYLLASVLLMISGLVLWVFWEAMHFLTAPIQAEHNANEIIFEVKPGEGFYKIAERLEKEKIVTSAFHFKILAKISGQAGSLRVGEYAIARDFRPIEVLTTLASGKSIERKITFPEGTNIFEMANLLQERGLGTRQEFLSLVQDPILVKKHLGEPLSSLEGYLYPETYSYTKYTPLAKLVEVMVERFKDVYKTIEAENKAGWSRHQIVTMASVIEKETGAPEERPQISSVFHNRLKKGMRLQSDPTILYGLLMQNGTMSGNIKREDILHPTPYNTYTVNGLPAGPIANPGIEALKAVVSPLNSNFFFFVSKNDGTHYFSSTLAEHNAAVKKFQLNREAREGKSWRDLSQQKKPTKPVKKLAR